MNKKSIIIFLPAIIFITLLANYKNILSHVFIKNFSKWTERSTKLEISKIDFLNSSIEINKIKIRNKDGFFNKNVFEAESIFIQFDFRSIFSNEVVIKKLIIHKPNFYFEIKTNSQKNKKVLDNLNLSEKVLKNHSPKIYPKKDKDKNFIIFELFIKNSRAHIHYSNNQDNLNLNLSDMAFSKVGNLKNEGNKKTQHYKDVLEIILKNIFIRIPDQKLKDLIKKNYKLN